jgi:hypothetical protein
VSDDAFRQHPEMANACRPHPAEYKAGISRANAYDPTVPALTCIAPAPPDISEELARRRTMAKGQLRGNKEAKKPKKPKQVVVPVSSFITPPKAGKPAKTQH